MSKKIPLSRGLYAIVDAADYEWLTQWKWCADSDGYAIRMDYSNGGKKLIRMHRLITDCPPGKQIDHINGAPADNRRANMRICTVAENSRNRQASRRNKSGFKGLHWSKRHNAWKVIIGFKGNIFLGYFKDKEAAARKYDEAAKKYHGEFANLNFRDGEE